MKLLARGFGMYPLHMFIAPGRRFLQGNWLKMDLRELESHLPKDVLAPLVYGQETLGDLLRFNYRTIPRAEPAI